MPQRPRCTDTSTSSGRMMLKMRFARYPYLFLIYPCTQDTIAQLARWSDVVESLLVVCAMTACLAAHAVGNPDVLGLLARGQARLEGKRAYSNTYLTQPLGSKAVSQNGALRAVAARKRADRAFHKLRCRYQAESETAESTAPSVAWRLRSKSVNCHQQSPRREQLFMLITKFVMKNHPKY